MRKKGVFLGKPVKGATKPKKLKKKRFGVKKQVKKKSGKGTKTKKEKKQFTRVGRFGSKKSASKFSKKLKGADIGTKTLKRSVRTRGGGPKIETSFSVYAQE